MADFVTLTGSRDPEVVQVLFQRTTDGHVHVLAYQHVPAYQVSSKLDEEMLTGVLTHRHYDRFC